MPLRHPAFDAARPITIQSVMGPHLLLRAPTGLCTLARFHMRLGRSGVRLRALDTHAEIVLQANRAATYTPLEGPRQTLLFTVVWQGTLPPSLITPQARTNPRPITDWLVGEILAGRADSPAL